MVCFGFKGGIGTASRVVAIEGKRYTVGVLVQCNSGDRKVLRIAGAPVGRALAKRWLPCVDPRLAKGTGEWKPCTAEGTLGEPPPDNGSIIIVVGTDAPLSPLQLNRVARRSALGLARLGSYSGNQSGDLIVSFSTAAAEVNHPEQGKPSPIAPLANLGIDPLFEAAVEATEEAIVNALVAARTMTGVKGTRIFALPHDELRAILKRYNRLEGAQMNDLPRVTYSNTGEDFSGVHAHLDAVIPEAEARLLGRRRPALIAGRDRDEGRVLEARSPIDRDILLGEFPQADAALVDEAVEAARAAYPAWRDLGWERRVALLRAGADMLEQRKWDVSIACLIEVGKSRLEAVGEVEEAIDLVRHYCAEMERTGGFREDAAGRRRRAVERRPSPLWRVRSHRTVQLPGRAGGRDDVGRARRWQHGRLQAERLPRG